MLVSKSATYMKKTDVMIVTFLNITIVTSVFFILSKLFSKMLGVVKISDQQNSKFWPKPISTLSAIQMQKPTARTDIILKQF